VNIVKFSRNQKQSGKQCIKDGSSFKKPEKHKNT